LHGHLAPPRPAACAETRSTTTCAHPSPNTAPQGDSDAHP
jgi:hypothetical protein